MSLIPAFEIGLWNAWLFMILYPLQWLATIFMPRRAVERTSHPVGINTTKKEKLFGKLTELCWYGATLYAIFLPLETGTAWFYIGLGFFIVGFIILIMATVAVIRAPEGKPFSDSVYRISRHPMYLSMILVYTGVSIASASWLFAVITVITFFLQNFQMQQEEKYCLETFGAAYRSYMLRTRRWFGLPR